MEGAMEREAERPEREDKSRLSCLDISLCLSWDENLDINVPNW